MDWLFQKLPAEIRMQIYDYVLKVDVVRLRPHDQESLKRIRQIREEEPRWNLAIDKYPFVDALASTDVSSAICCTCRLAYQESTDTLYSNKLFIPFQYIPALQCNFLPEIGCLNARNIRELSIGLTQDDALRPWFSQGMCPLFDFPVRINYRRNNRPKRLSHSIIALLNTMYPLSKSSLSLLCTEAEGGGRRDTCPPAVFRRGKWNKPVAEDSIRQRERRDTCCPGCIPQALFDKLQPRANRQH